MSYLRLLCLFVYCDVQHILGCVFLFFFVLCALCCQFLWIVQFLIVPSVFTNIYLFIQPLFIEMPVPCQESWRLCICVRRINFAFFSTYVLLIRIWNFSNSIVLLCFSHSSFRAKSWYKNISMFLVS